MTTEQKFNAAVNVIRSLPKNGSYQPSNDLMLRFYAYFKQATLGPCTGRRPAFYDLVGRAKYDAWKALGDMSKETAMAKYVDELHTIIETMSYSDKVANFLEAPTEEVECVSKIMDDLEIIAGDVIERVRSQPNSPLASREASPIRLNYSGDNSPLSTPSPDLNESDQSDDEYSDTMEFPETKKMISNGSIYPELTNSLGGKLEHISRSRTKQQSNVDVSNEVSKAVQSLRLEIERLTYKINTLEHSNSLVKRNKGLNDMPFKLIAFIIVWPFLASFIMKRYFYSRK